MRALLATLFVFIFSFPNLAMAQLVPVACNDPDSCGTCEFAAMINNIIQFIIEVGVLLAVASMIYAGFMFVTARGNEGQLTKARGIFTNVVIGLVLILAAFLIVNTVMNGLLGTGNGAVSWQQIECLYPNAASGLRDTSNFDNGGAGFGIVGGGQAGLLTPEQFAANEGVCGSDFLTPYFGSQAAAASCIVAGETSCGATLLSTTDRDANGVPFSVGAFQINMTVHPVIGCGATLNCPDAYSGSNYNAVIVDQALYNACRNALLDPNCSATNAVRIYNDGGWSPWSTASGCGLI